MLSGVSDQLEFVPCAILFNGVRISRFPQLSVFNGVSLLSPASVLNWKVGEYFPGGPDVGVVVVVVVVDVVVDAVCDPPTCRNGFV